MAFYLECAGGESSIFVSRFATAEGNKPSKRLKNSTLQICRLLNIVARIFCFILNYQVAILREKVKDHKVHVAACCALIQPDRNTCCVRRSTGIVPSRDLFLSRSSLSQVSPPVHVSIESLLIESDNAGEGYGGQRGSFWLFVQQFAGVELSAQEFGFLTVSRIWSILPQAPKSPA